MEVQWPCSASKLKSHELAENDIILCCQSWNSFDTPWSRKIILLTFFLGHEQQHGDIFTSERFHSKQQNVFWRRAWMQSLGEDDADCCSGISVCSVKTVSAYHCGDSCIKILSMEVILHLSYSPDLSLRKWHLFGPFKAVLIGIHFHTEEAECVVQNW